MPDHTLRFYGHSCLKTIREFKLLWNSISATQSEYHIMLMEKLRLASVLEQRHAAQGQVNIHSKNSKTSLHIIPDTLEY